jgi:DNA-binding NtrC family response regulator
MLTNAFVSMLMKQGFLVHVAAEESAVESVFANHIVSTAIVSMDTTGIDGLRYIETISKSHPAIIILAVTENPTASQVAESLELGAKDYFVRPIQDWNRFYVQLRQAQKLWSEQLELLQLRQAQSEMNEFREYAGLDGIKGRSNGIRQVLSQIQNIAPLDVSTLIIGESGVGKERVAKALHSESGRTGSFVAINCASISPELFEAELFGHRKGSFTGASQSRAGLCQVAAGGTLFLDEVGELPFSLQAKLLRLLEQKEYRPVGSDTTEPFTGRIVTATNVDLESAVLQKRFREDLYYRISVQELYVPPLRERIEDIQLLAYHFVEKFNEPCNRQITTISAEALTILEAYDWYRNNVRELQREIQRALVRAKSTDVMLLPTHLFWKRGTQEIPQNTSVVVSEQTEPNWFDESYTVAKKRAHMEFLSSYLPYQVERYNGSKAKAAQACGIKSSNFSRLWKEMIDNQRDKS